MRSCNVTGVPPAGLESALGLNNLGRLAFQLALPYSPFRRAVKSERDALFVEALV